MFAIAAKYTRKLRRQGALLAELEKRLASEKEVDARRRIAHIALYYAVFAGHNRWSSPVIERVYQEWANSLSCELAKDFNPATCLLVMTKACAVGGLEQLVYRWVESDPSRRYSVALTRMGNDALPPLELDKCVRSSGGSVERIWCGKTSETAVRLRTLASHYETVVVLTYEDDEVPLLAFGTARFKRPVGLYNQSDHHFWVNVSIADIVADMRLWGQGITLNHRGAHESLIVPVVSDFKQACVHTKQECRELLGLRQDVKIVVSAGRTPKYTPLCGLDFMSLAAPILRSHKDIQLILIGPEKRNFKKWKKYFSEFGQRVSLIGNVSHETLIQYYSAADLMLDSFPVCGQIATLDASSAGCPILTTSETLDYLVEGGACCPNGKSFVPRAIELLYNDRKARENVQSVRNAISRLMSIDVFCLRRDLFLSSLSKKTHAVTEFSTTPTDYIFEDYIKLEKEGWNYQEYYFYALKELGTHKIAYAALCLQRLLSRYYKGIMRRVDKYRKCMMG